MILRSFKPELGEQKQVLTDNIAGYHSIQHGVNRHDWQQSA